VLILIDNQINYAKMFNKYLLKTNIFHYIPDKGKDQHNFQYYLKEDYIYQ
jgi:hypothetical protein